MGLLTGSQPVLSASGIPSNSRSHFAFNSWLIACYERTSVTMSQFPSPSPSTSNFRTVFVAAMKEYEKKTKTDLHTHPLATQLQSCTSSSDIVAVLHAKVNEFDKSRSQNERLSSWLNPTINVLYAFSATLGQGAGLVSLNSLTDRRLIVFTDILAREYHLCWYRSSLLGEHLP